MFVIFTIKNHKTKAFSNRKLKTVTPILTFLFTGLLICIFSVAKSFGQAPTIDEGAVKDTILEFHSLTITDGLSQNSVHQIFQDEHGFMWFATEFGVDRYDGTFDNTETYDLLDKELRDNVSLFYEDHKTNVLLVATKKKLYRINCHTGITDTIISAPDNIVFVSSLNESRKEILVFADSGSYILNGNVIIPNRDTLSTADIKINCVVKLNPKVYLLGTSKGLLRYDYDRSNSRLSYSMINIKNNITHLAYSKENHLLYYVEDKNTKSFLGKATISDQFIVKAASSIWSRDLSDITALHIDNQQQLWIGTRYQGLLFIYDHQVYKARASSSNVDFTQYEILSLHQSADGVMWVGTIGGGVFMLQEKKQHFQHYFNKSAAKSGSNHTWSINKYKNYLLAGTIKDGLAIIDINNPTDTVQWVRPKGISKTARTIYSIVEGKDRFFLGTENGIYQVSFKELDQLESNKQVTYSSAVFNGSRIPYLFYDQELDYLWVSQRTKKATAKLHILDASKPEYPVILQNFTAQFNSDRIDVIKKYPWDDGSGTPDQYCFFIGWGKGLTGFTQQDLKEEKTVSTMYDSTGIYGLHHIGDTVKLGDDLWLGTDRKGLIKLNIKTKEATYIGESKGAPKDIIYAILSDPAKTQLWFSTNHGLWKYNLRSKRFNQYKSIGNNLQSDEFNAGAYFTINDTLLFGGINGITVFFPIADETKTPNEKLAIYIRSPHQGIDTTLLLSPDKSSAYLDPVPRDFNSLFLTPSVLNYQDPGNNQFQYCVNCKGGREKWKYTEKNNSIELVSDDLNLGSPANEIKIRIRNSNSEWSDPYLIYSKVSYFSDTVWALLLAGVFLFFLSITFWLQKKASNKLNDVHTKINDVSRLNKLEDICVDALFDFIRVFKMDYAIISLIDFNERKLVARGKINKKNDEVYWEKLIENPPSISVDKESLTNDFLLNCINQNKNNTRFGHKDTDIHNTFYEKEKNEKNAKPTQRFLFPIIHRAKEERAGDKSEKQKQEDLTMGVIEVGYCSWFSRLMGLIKRKTLTYRKRINLELYIDNFAQPYYRALLEEKKTELYEATISHNLNEEKHQSFLQKFINDLTRVTNADYGSIALKTLNFPNTNLIEKNIISERGNSMKKLNLSSIDPAIIEKVQLGTQYEGMMRYVMKNLHPHFSNDLQSLNKKDLYINLYPGIESEMAAPMIPTSYKFAGDSQEYVIGALALSSRTPNFFNKIQMEAVDTLTQKVTEEYLKIRLRWSLSQLTQPFDIFSGDVMPIYKQIVKSLEGYFDSNYISVWEKDTESEFSIFKLAYATPDLNKAYRKHNILHGHIKRHAHNPNDPLSFVKLVQEHKDQASIRDLCTDYKFECYIVIRIVIDGNYEGFINIFSKRLLSKELKKNDRVFLDQIAEKVGMALQSTKMISSIKAISESLVDKDQQTTLQEIVDSAVDVIHADLVSLFYYDDEEKYIVNKTYWSKNYEKETKTDKSSRFADSILKNGTKYIETEEQYNKILKLAPSHYPDDIDKPGYSHFWKDAKLRSVVGVCLEFNDRKIGVMIFNFKSQKNFSKEETRRFIEGFANLAKAAILNAGFLDEIRKNLRKLEEKNKNLEEQKQTLEKQKQKLSRNVESIYFDYKEVQKKMEALIPQAFRTSFYTIMDGTNHDIRNCLIDIKLNIINIQGHYEGLPSDEKTAIDNSTKSIDYNIGIIENLFDLFDLKKREKADNDVNELITRQITYWKHRKPKIDFDDSDLDHKIPDLLCFKVDLSMIIFNLVNNAVHAIEKQNREQGKISFKTEIKEENILITIQDNGTGIPKDKRPLIFNAGFTTKDGGIGIGLYYVKETLKNHFNNASIYLVSAKLEHGTTFIIRIPVNQKTKK